MSWGKYNLKWPKIRDYLAGKELVLAALLAAGVIITGVFLGWYNNRVVPVNPDVKAHYLKEPGNHLSFMANWDGIFYLQIAHVGYKSTADTGFFPLYPQAARAASVVLRSPLYSALAVSWVSLVGAIFFFIKILKQLFKIDSNLEVLRGVLFFAIFPPAVVFLATYSESLFALVSLGAIYFALNKRYLPAAIMTLLATATRIDGIFLLALVVLILYEQKEKWPKILATGLIGCLGMLGYMIFLLIDYRNPLEFINAQRTNGWLNAGYFSHLSSSFNLLNIAVIALLITAAVYWWKRRKSFAIYSLLFLTIPLVGGQFEGFDRYAIMAFPFQFMLYGWLRDKKLAYAVAIAMFGIFWGYFMVQYAGGYTGT